MPKEKNWYAFYSVNGTEQHRKEMTEEKASEFAKEEGYVGRYKQVPKPVRDLETENRKRKRK